MSDSRMTPRQSRTRLRISGTLCILIGLGVSLLLHNVEIGLVIGLLLGLIGGALLGRRS